MDTAHDELLGVGEAATLLNVSNGTIRRWSDSGALQAVRTPGGQRRFRRSDVVALLSPESVEQ